ncbi:hypothetical protein SRHO_G00210590 [Serrasalmus rhombeus]
MKGLTLLLFAGLMFIQRSTAADLSISANTKSDSAELKCDKGKWQKENIEETLTVQYTEDRNEVETCKEDVEGSEISRQILVRVRTCENCIEMNIAAITAIAIGNILATILIGVAVYSLTAQPKGKSFSGNKASDKEHLIRNGDGDTYQPLAPGQKSEYQTLGGARRK